MTMKRCVFPALIVFFITILGACTAAPDPDDGKVDPGEKIGDFRVTTGKADDFVLFWDLDCAKQEDTGVFACQADVDTKVNVSLGIFDPSSSGELDKLWSNHTYEMFIDDQLVNLPAFGPVDVENSTVGTMRHWNVVISARAPGEIKIHSVGIAGVDPFDETVVINFTAP
jgi:hypothetical protein